MRINNNIMALNAHRQLAINQASGSKAMEKLSSGLRINRSADDAAGLAISEKMRGQIHGLRKAQRNAQDGISLIQTAEGALNEVHAILQRMRELAVQAANDTNVAIDRREIQREINQLSSEINRIGNSTEFNTKKLLNGGEVDPTEVVGRAENMLEVDANLRGGEGATEQLASAQFVFAEVAAGQEAALDGESFTVTLGQPSFGGNTSLTVVYDSSIGINGSHFADNTITLGIRDGATATQLADAFSAQLNSFVVTNDTYVGRYNITTDGGNVGIRSIPLSQDQSGEIQGAGTAGTVTVSNNEMVMGVIARSPAVAVNAKNTTFVGGSSSAYNGLQLVIDNSGVAAGNETVTYDAGANRITLDLDGAANYTAGDLNALLQDAASYTTPPPANIDVTQLSIIHEDGQDTTAATGTLWNAGWAVGAAAANALGALNGQTGVSGSAGIQAAVATGDLGSNDEYNILGGASTAYNNLTIEFVEDTSTHLNSAAIAGNTITVTLGTIDLSGVGGTNYAAENISGAAIQDLIRNASGQPPVGIDLSNITIVNTAGADTPDRSEWTNVAAGRSFALGGGTNRTVSHGAIGVNATSTIDFSETTTAQLHGTGIVVKVDNTLTRVDFFDSGIERYSGNADFAIDLNQARTPEQIVNRIAQMLAGPPGGNINNQQYAIAGDTTATYSANGNAIAGVFVTRSDDGQGLQIIAEQAGAIGNGVQLQNLVEVEVTAVHENARLSGSAVNQAIGLQDGEHTVTISNVAARVGQVYGLQPPAGTGLANATHYTLTADDPNMASATYDLQVNANNELVISRLVDGNWSVVETLPTAGPGALSTAVNDSYLLGNTGLRITIDDAAFAWTANDNAMAEVIGQHYAATVTEAGSTGPGAAVKVANGEERVILTPLSTVGYVDLDIGAWNSPQIGESVSWSFETQAGQAQSALSLGEFVATLQIGANFDQSMDVVIDDVRSLALRITGDRGGESVKASDDAEAFYVGIPEVNSGVDSANVEHALDVSNHRRASAAISVINDAIEHVSTERSKLGAYQNRLEHSIANLGTAVENLQAAESRIRDLDMAEEMMEFTKNNILQQAATAMLAQANMAPQSVLQLLG